MAESKSESKFCRDCGDHRPVTDFWRDSRRADGFAFYCKTHARQRWFASRDRKSGPPRRRHAREAIVPPDFKWCPDCESVKPVEDFPRTRASQSGVAAYCKPCHNARGKASKDKVGGSRTYHLKRRYGITAEDFDVLLAAQAGLCAICRAAPAEHVDHDHATGRVRQLLCFNCNGGLGQFKDDPRVLRQAATYVERHRHEQAEVPAAEGPHRSRSQRARTSSDPDRLALRRRAAGCPSTDLVRSRVAALIASLDRPAAG